MNNLDNNILTQSQYERLNLQFVKGDTKKGRKKIDLYIISKDNQFNYKWKYFIDDNKANYQLVEKKRIEKENYPK